MQFFVNYLFKIYRLLFTIFLNIFFICKYRLDLIELSNSLTNWKRKFCMLIQAYKIDGCQI